jgi:hypothetical protein
MGTYFEGARVPYDRHARLPALHRGDLLRSHRASSSDRRDLPLTLSRQHLRHPSSDESQPSKAAPSSGADSDCASWDEVANLACRRRLPAPPTERLRGTPSVSRDATEHSRNICVRQAYRATSCTSRNGVANVLVTTPSGVRTTAPLWRASRLPKVLRAWPRRSADARGRRDRSRFRR